MNNIKLYCAAFLIFSFFEPGSAQQPLQLSESTYDYGNVDLGNNKDHTFTATNVGDMDYQVEEIFLQQHWHGNTNPDFIIIGGEIRIPVTLHPGDSHDITVRFSPTLSDPASADLFISSVTGPWYSIQLSGIGMGIEQDIFSNIASIFFGKITIGNYKHQSFIIGNAGHADLSISETAIEGTGSSHYMITDGGGPRILGGGQTTSIQVTFRPLSNGEKVAECWIYSSDPDVNPYKILLFGTGLNAVQDLDFTGSPVDFGAVNPGGIGEKRISLENNGMIALNISTLTIIGPNASEYSLLNTFPLPAVIPSDNDLTCILRFTPISTGLKTATLRINSDDPDENPFDIQLTGMGTSGEVQDIDSNPRIWNYGDVDAGRTRDKSFLISNVGNADLIVTNTRLVGGDMS